MIETIKRDFVQGLKTFKFWAEVFSERVKVEINVFKILNEIRRLNERRDELLRELGMETMESWKSSKELEDNERIFSLIRKIKELDEKIEEQKRKIQELGELTKWKF